MGGAYELNGFLFSLSFPGSQFSFRLRSVRIVFVCALCVWLFCLCMYALLHCTCVPGFVPKGKITFHCCHFLSVTFFPDFLLSCLTIFFPVLLSFSLQFFTRFSTRQEKKVHFFLFSFYFSLTFWLTYLFTFTSVLF